MSESYFNVLTLLLYTIIKDLLDADMAQVDDGLVDAVVADGISLPKTPSTRDSDVRAFFRFQPMQTTPASSSSLPTATAKNPHGTQLTLDALRRPLPLPLSLRNKGLTRSQLIFSIGTAIDPRALQITGDEEFYLFMDMRAEYQWTSFGMTASKWAPAAKLYNSRLEAIGKKKNIAIIKKHPRALMEKLAEIEPRIIERILRQDSQGDQRSISAKKNNTSAFWSKHCFAVPALVGKAENLRIINTGDTKKKVSRKRF
jgi:hypothetical protein